MGLDDGLYGSVQSKILSTDPLPSTSKAFSMVNQEEKRRVVSKYDEQVGVAAFTKGELLDGQPRPVVERPMCNYCRRLGHVKETCWQLYSRPADCEFRPSNQRFKPKGRAVKNTPNGARKKSSNQQPNGLKQIGPSSGQESGRVCASQLERKSFSINMGYFKIVLHHLYNFPPFFGTRKTLYQHQF